MRGEDAVEYLEALAGIDDGSDHHRWLANGCVVDLSPLGGELEAPRFLIDDWLPCGYATMLAGHGGAGKSSIALSLAACLAMGRAWCGLETHQRRVLYISCEDRASVLQWRLQRVCQHHEIDHVALASELVLLDMVGHDTMLWTEREMMTGQMRNALIAMAECIRESGAQVVIIDGVSDVFGGDENDRAHVKAFINELMPFIDAADGALVLLAHVNKTTANDPATAQGYSGSTAWHNAVRARWYLYPEMIASEEGGKEATGELLLDLQKSNLGLARGQLRFRWHSDDKLYTGQLVQMSRASDKRSRLLVERYQVLDLIERLAHNNVLVGNNSRGPNSPWAVLSEQPDFPATIMRMAQPKARLKRHVEALLGSGELRVADGRDSNRRAVPILEVVRSSGSNASD